MGLLKHVLLPLFAFLHTFSLVSHFVLQQDIAVIAKLPTHDQERTPLELHYAAAIHGALAVLLFGCLIGIFHENSHFRGIVAVMHFIFFANDAIDTWRRGPEWDPTVMTVFAGVWFIAILVHSQEPGFFTKDKKASKKD